MNSNFFPAHRTIIGQRFVHDKKTWSMKKVLNDLAAYDRTHSILAEKKSENKKKKKKNDWPGVTAVVSCWMIQ